MRYKNETTINASRETVVNLFNNPENISKWQPGFIAMEHIEGTPGEIGSKSKLHYKMGKREIEMIETITQKELPNIFGGTYEAKNVWNEVINHFEELPDGTTKYWTENEFRMSGFMKLIAWLMPGAFKKQSQKYLELFKEFVESNSTSVE